MRLTNRITAVGLFVLFLTAYYTALNYPPASAAYPKLLMSIGMIFSVGLFAQSFFPGFKEGEMTTIAKHDLINLLVSLGIMALYIVTIPVIGYVTSTFSYMMAQMWILNRNSKIRTLFLIAVVVNIILYVSFGILLNVFLPKGILF